MRVGLEVVLTVIDHDWAELLHHAKHGRAAGATVEPDNDGVLLRVVHRRGEGVVERLGVGDLEVATIGVGLEGGGVGQVRHQVFLGRSQGSSGQEGESEELHTEYMLSI